MNQQSNIRQKTNKLDQTENLLKEISHNANIVNERLFLDYITGTGANFPEVSLGAKFRTLLISPGKMRGYKDLCFIRNTARRFLDKIRLCEITGNCIVAVTEIIDLKTLSEPLTAMQEELNGTLTYNICIICGNPGSLIQLPRIYERLTEKMEYTFYAEGKTVFEEDEIQTNALAPLPDYSGFENALKYGDAINTDAILESFFNAIKKEYPRPETVKECCYKLYAHIIRCCPPELWEKYVADIDKFGEFVNIYEIERFITDKAMEIVNENDPHNAKTYSSLIKDTVKIINDNIGNENLSLRWLAGTILFTNVDYLGKLFKKETGKNFSHYVMEKRMELAKTLIVEKDRVYEVAEKVGYGSNSQYFSHVFKKYTGISPLEYKEYAKGNQLIGLIN